MSKKVTQLKVAKKLLSEKRIEKDGQIAKLKETQRMIDLLDSSIKELQKKVNKLSGDGSIGIIDHAIVRYLERIEGVNLDEIKDKILPPDHSMRDSIKTLGGSGTFPIDRSHNVVIKKWSVVTVIPQGKQ